MVGLSAFRELAITLPVLPAALVALPAAALPAQIVASSALWPL